MGTNCTKDDNMSSIKSDIKSYTSCEPETLKELLPGITPEERKRIEELFVAKRYLYYIMMQGLGQHEYLVEILQLMEKRNKEVAEANKSFRSEKEKKATAARALERMEIEVLEYRQYLTKIRAEMQELFEYLRERRQVEKDLMEENSVLNDHINKRKKLGSALKEKEFTLNTEISKWERRLKTKMKPPKLSDSEDEEELLASINKPPATGAGKREMTEIPPHTSQISRSLAQPLCLAKDLTEHTTMEEWLQMSYKGSVEEMVKDLDNCDQTLASGISKAMVYSTEVNEMLEEVIEEVHNTQAQLVSLWERTRAAEQARLQDEAELSKLHIERDYTKDSIRVVKAQRAKLADVIREAEESVFTLSAINHKLRAGLLPLSHAQGPSSPSERPSVSTPPRGTRPSTPSKGLTKAMSTPRKPSTPSSLSSPLALPKV